MSHTTFDRPRFLRLFFIAFLFFSFAPILVVALFSFNSSPSLQNFTGFSLEWYDEFLSNVTLRRSLFASLEIATVTMIVATFLGTTLAFGLVRARLAALNREVEEAALDLGATRLQTIRLVVLPALWPAILASGLLIFALSFDDFVLSFFTTGESPTPLPVQIYSSIRFGVTPTINAIGTLMLFISFAIIAVAVALPRLIGRQEETVLTTTGEGA